MSNPNNYYNPIGSAPSEDFHPSMALNNYFSPPTAPQQGGAFGQSTTSSGVAGDVTMVSDDEQGTRNTDKNVNYNKLIERPSNLVLHCRKCNRDCVSLYAYLSHVDGSKHFKSAAKAPDACLVPRLVTPNLDNIVRKFLCKAFLFDQESQTSFRRTLNELMKYVMSKRKLRQFVNSSGLMQKISPDFIFQTKGKETELQDSDDEGDSVEEIKPVGTGFLEVISKDDGSLLCYSCTLCDCRFNDPRARDAHLAGRRHRLEYKKLIDQDILVELIKADKNKINLEKEPEAIAPEENAECRRFSYDPNPFSDGGAAKVNVVYESYAPIVYDPELQWTPNTISGFLLSNRLHQVRVSRSNLAMIDKCAAQVEKSIIWSMAVISKNFLVNSSEYKQQRWIPGEVLGLEHLDDLDFAVEGVDKYYHNCLVVRTGILGAQCLMYQDSVFDIVASLSLVPTTHLLLLLAALIAIKASASGLPEGSQVEVNFQQKREILAVKMTVPYLVDKKGTDSRYAAFLQKTIHKLDEETTTRDEDQTGIEDQTDDSDDESIEMTEAQRAESTMKSDYHNSTAPSFKSTPITGFKTRTFTFELTFTSPYVSHSLPEVIDRIPDKISYSRMLYGLQAIRHLRFLRHKANSNPMIRDLLIIIRDVQQRHATLRKLSLWQATFILLRIFIDSQHPVSIDDMFRVFLEFFAAGFTNSQVHDPTNSKMLLLFKAFKPEDHEAVIAGAQALLRYCLSRHMDIVLSLPVPELSNFPMRVKSKRKAKRGKKPHNATPRKGFAVGCLDNCASRTRGQPSLFYKEAFHHYIDRDGVMQRAWADIPTDYYASTRPAGIHPFEVIGPVYPEDEEAAALGLAFDENEERNEHLNNPDQASQADGEELDDQQDVSAQSGEEPEVQFEVHAQAYGGAFGSQPTPADSYQTHEQP